MAKITRLSVAAIAAALSIALIAAPATAQRAGEAATSGAKDAAKAASKKTSTTKKGASPCKGLSEVQCKANTSCSFVGATTRKSTGKKVAAYCRLKSSTKKN